MTAIELINTIAQESGCFELEFIRNVTEDGANLSQLGVGDDDQEMVEEAHWMLTEWMRKGLTSLPEAND